MADKIADIDNSISAISTKVTEIDSSLDEKINYFGIVMQRMSDKLTKLLKHSNLYSVHQVVDDRRL